MRVLQTALSATQVVGLCAWASVKYVVVRDTDNPFYLQQLTATVLDKTVCWANHMRPLMLGLLSSAGGAQQEGRL